MCVREVRVRWDPDPSLSDGVSTSAVKWAVSGPSMEEAKPQSARYMKPISLTLFFSVSLCLFPLIQKGACRNLRPKLDEDAASYSKLIRSLHMCPDN